MDDAGNVTDMSAGANVVTLVPDDASALARIGRSGGLTLFNTYDGRGFLARAEVWKGEPPVFTEAWSTPTYSSDGTLMSLEEVKDAGATWTRTNILYFAGRPVALWRKSQSGAASTSYLTTDHLGTPVFALAANGTTLWHGGFEPFGRDWQAGTSSDSLKHGIPLRLPGQWLSAEWEYATLGMQVYYNVHRWYEPATGRYASPDSLGLRASLNSHGYVDARPTQLLDPLGLLSVDPQSCGGFGGSECCFQKLKDAGKGYNELFTPGWRQRKPRCWKSLASAHRRSGWGRPKGDQHSLSPWLCMTQHQNQVVKCDATYRRERGMGYGGCGITEESGQTYFRPEVCDEAKCQTPLSTLFHEQLHRCGAPPHWFGNQDDDIVQDCIRN